MGELINGCDTTDNGVPAEQALATVPLANACTEIDMCGTGEVKASRSMQLVRDAIGSGQRVLIIAPTGRAAAAMRGHLSTAGIPVTPIADMRDRGDGGIAVETVGDLAGGTFHSTIGETGRIAANMRAPSSGMGESHLVDVSIGGQRDLDSYRQEMDLTGVMMVVDESGDLDPAHMEAVHSWLGRPFGPGKSATMRRGGMADDTMDRLFGDDVIERERRARHSYVLCDEDRLGGRLAAVAMKACLPERSGFDHRCENDAFNRRNGTRTKPTRGRYK